MMTTRWVALAALAAFQGTPTPLDSEAGRFRLTMPAEATASEQSIPTDSGPMALHLFTALVGDGSFVLSYSDLPTGKPEADAIDSVLDGAARAVARSLEGEQVRTEKKEVAGRPGREIRMKLKIQGEDRASRIRIVLDGARLYQMIAIGADEFPSSKPVLEAMDSFRITPEKKPEPAEKPKG